MKAPNTTPGPWTFQPCPENTWNVSGHILAKGETVETATAMCKGEANAKAVSALPDCLAALTEALGYLDSMPPQPKGSVREVAHHGTRHVVVHALHKAGYTF